MLALFFFSYRNSRREVRPVWIFQQPHYFEDVIKIRVEHTYVNRERESMMSIGVKIDKLLSFCFDILP